MARRRSGALVVAVALLAAVVVPNLSTRSVPGAAVVQPPPGPPAIGDCVLQSFDTGRTIEPAGTGWRARYPAPAIGLCRGAVFGQISAVIQDPAPVQPPTAADPIGPRDPNQDSCAGSGLDEWLPAGSRDGTADGGWSVGLAQSVSLLAPSPRQVAAGQRWLACAVAPAPDSSGVTAGYPAPVTQWRRSRPVADALGTCALTTSPTFLGAQDCSITHSAEQFGVASGPVTPARAAGCRTLVTDLTGMPDPTAGGRLRVEVVAYGSDGIEIAGPGSASVERALCMVVGDGSYLNGSLLALGGDPVPFG